MTDRARVLTIEVSPGELIDKLTILEIKLERITEVAKRANVEREYAYLRAEMESGVKSSETLEAATKGLRAVNSQLWDVEDALRDCERRADFGADFVELARSVYRLNDRRSQLKRQINELLGSRWIEEKSYANY